LKKAGYQIGVAGNQPEACEAALRAAGVPADVIASSSGWGVEKPSLQFFERIVEAAGVAPSSIVYVGDRYDNDIAPAHQAGLIPIFIRRGPWAFLQGEPANADFKFARVESLGDLPRLISTL
jgi:FMN phosphatase YigB (HAD superfamily)